MVIVNKPERRECMNHFVVINSKSFGRLLMFSIFVASAFIWFNFQTKVTPAFNEEEQVREIHMVTGEFSTETEEGKEIEAYRFDPGTIFLQKGEKVNLRIFGVNGDEHAFTIEGTDIKGKIQKGKETVIPLQFDKPGTYRLICITHKDIENNGPMIAYIVVK